MLFLSLSLSFFLFFFYFYLGKKGKNIPFGVSCRTLRCKTAIIPDFLILSPFFFT